MKNDIKEDYVSFEVSKLLKKIGFGWKSYEFVKGEDGKPKAENIDGVPMDSFNGFPCYEEEGNPINPRKYTAKNKHYPRPTQNVALKWLLENFNVNIETQYDFISYDVIIYGKGFDHKIISSLSDHPDAVCYKSKEDAINAGLIHVLTKLNEIQNKI